MAETLHYFKCDRCNRRVLSEFYQYRMTCQVVNPNVLEEKEFDLCRDCKRDFVDFRQNLISVAPQTGSGDV